MPFDGTSVEEAAQEVGLSPAAVRQAVAELRVGVLPAEPRGRRARRDTRVLSSRRVSDQRLVDRSPAEAQALIDRYLRTQMFEVRRRSGDRSLYRHRADLVAGFEQWEAPLRSGLATMRERGLLRADADPDRLALALLAALQGGLLLTQTRRTTLPLETALDAMIELIRSYEV